MENYRAEFLVTFIGVTILKMFGLPIVWIVAPLLILFLIKGKKEKRREEDENTEDDAFEESEDI